MGNEWLDVPVGINAGRWVTRQEFRSVLVTAHTMVSLQRLLDVVELVEGDPHVQVLYTRPPDVFHRGVRELLHELGALEISWHQAVRERFDLILAAAYDGLPDLHGPIMVLAHGAGYAKRIPAHVEGRPVERDVYGLSGEQLVHGGRVVPASIVLAHETQRELLARTCPAAVEVAVVAGDPCYDRLRVSVPLRRRYREALGLGPKHRLVVVASTWGRHSLFTRDENLLTDLARSLDPSRYRVAALLHPAVWFGHGRRQVRAWLSAPRAAGMLLIEPEVDWRAAIVAADHVIGDHGSVPVYAASLGKPVLHTDLPIDELDSRSPQAFLGARARRLIRSAPIEPQLRAAARDLPPDWSASVATRLTSRPGISHVLLREEMYRLLGLPVPGRHRAVGPVPVPSVGEVRRHA